MSLISRQVFNKINNFRQMSVLASVLRYNEYGDPVKVVKQCEEKMNGPSGDEILIKTLAAPINPADINTIQGKYPVKPTFPAVPGNECVGEIIAIGSNIKRLKVGDKVVPFSTGLGTWRSHALYNENDVMKVPANLGIAESATITVNPCTSYRMLKDFVDLKPGDSVIQNGANSACGQSIIQLCKAWGINCIGVVRNRSDIDNLKVFLKGLGAFEILTEEELRVTTIFKSGACKKPKLALNCVGGKNALEIIRHMDHAGIMVTYGGMSREPVTIPTSALIFKDLQFSGFWMTRWTKFNANSPKRREMFDELIKLLETGELKAPAHELVAFSDFKSALANSLNLQGFAGKKFIFKF